jgi:Asp-tRNA(Asn)/Glu-tRNA(Gln) amidotransferase A subunit family amidase
MATNELCDWPATRLAAAIRARRLSPVEVVQACLARIESVNPALNAFCFVYPEEALDRARAAERAVGRIDDLGPLHGVPIAIKDFTPTKGKRTTQGSYLREHWVPDEDAIVVDRLLAAGAILVGKTTTPEFAHSFFTNSPLWGVTRNPWNVERTPGGSSGGSAAAVAAGCVPLAEGSDMGGSIRTPAAFCGVVGLKPSFGRIPFEIMPSSLDPTCHFGPIARTVEDAALFLQATSGPDERDPQSQRDPMPVALPLNSDLTGLRLAWSPDLGCYAIDEQVHANSEAAVAALRSAGAVVEAVEVGLSPEVEQAGWALWDAYYAALLKNEIEEWRDRMTPSLVACVERGLAMSAVELKEVEFRAKEGWNQIAPVLRQFDALICPTTAHPAPPVGGADEDYGTVDDQGRYHSLELTFPFNLMGRCPALSVPSGLTPEGLPTGLQIIGRRFDDPTVLRIGAGLEVARPWSKLRPRM